MVNGWREGRAGMLFRKIFILSFILLLQSCMPRGETRTLDEIFAQAEQRYESVGVVSGLPQDVSGALREVGAGLKKLGHASPEEDIVGAARSIAPLLLALTPKAGYPSRASLGELAEQYRVFTRGATGVDTRSKARLLVARTYTLLATELETTKFLL